MSRIVHKDVALIVLGRVRKDEPEPLRDVEPLDGAAFPEHGRRGRHGAGVGLLGEDAEHGAEHRRFSRCACVIVC